MTEVKKKSRTRWVFATSQPRTLILQPAGVKPGRWVGDEFEPEYKVPTVKVVFGMQSKTYATYDKHVASLLMKNQSFMNNPKTDAGNIWLVSEKEIDIATNAEVITAPAPERSSGSQVVKGARGTSAGQRGKE